MKGHRAAELTGQKFGRLTVGRLLRTDAKSGRVWECLCECGKTCEKTTGHLRDKHNQNPSCGCALSESIKIAAPQAWLKTTKFSHPHKLKLKWLYRNMVNRCHKPGTRRYERYGGRGISVCDEWKNNPTAFYVWAVAHGYDPSLSIERKDRDGNYSPENCQFATAIEQANNTSRNRFITWEGKTQTVTQWERERGVSRGLFAKRIANDWPLERVFAQC